ncbi:flagellar assembly peptidoglycan hydrolase FlgJ [Azoarcus sp. KH32C]|uniref:flagellar assembly peptidoglycan hydrolase FlgJ n=1 Tax=Azoarcus sp. KH32C TaxID=748247 RepID=UPI00023864C4|nr:flagellar assembly peptidoglycan hydrolase FlgJ [Azoarcus sp. KH32C]BAL23636.1 peptidoglycan hydrolase [Azoarcus sp. KH32C]
MVAVPQINAMDPNAMADLKRLSRDNSPEALRAAAKQFEALFLQTVLKSMREAVPSDGMLDSDQTRMFQQLQDQQMAMNMAQGKGIGLADAIFRQMGGEAALKAQGGAAPEGSLDISHVVRRPANPALVGAGAANAAGDDVDLPGIGDGMDAALRLMRSRSGDASQRARTEASSAAAGANGAGGAGGRSVGDGAREFVNRVWNQAADASRSTGIPAHFMVAQAALESGWGRGELRRADGSPTHNLFNIKAGSNWKGDVVELPVTEYVNGRPQTETARFRAYGSYGEAFRDYANLLRSSPRYADVLGQTDAAGFARSLQQSGYATDPMYADKLTRIIGGATLRTALEG